MNRLKLKRLTVQITDFHKSMPCRMSFQLLLCEFSGFFDIFPAGLRCCKGMVSITYCKQKASTAILFCCECLCHLLCCLTLNSIAADMSASLHELCIVKLTKSVPDGIHILDYSMLYSCYIYCIFLCSTLASIKLLSVYRIINKQHNMWQLNSCILSYFHSRRYT